MKEFWTNLGVGTFFISPAILIVLFAFDCIGDEFHWKLIMYAYVGAYIYCFWGVFRPQDEEKEERLRKIDELLEKSQ